MQRNTLSLMGHLILWQLLRFGLLVLLLASRWQAYILWFVMGSTVIEAVTLGWLLRRHGVPATTSTLVPQLVERDRSNVRLVGMILCFCATGFASSIPLINGTTTVMPVGPDRVAATLTDITGMTSGCVRITDAQVHLSFLGAVRYTVSARVKQFFYAVPYEANDWTSDQPVRVWAILSESELSRGTFEHSTAATIVNPVSLHADAFRAAVANAEERYSLRSADGVVMVRLIDSVPSASLTQSNPTTGSGSFTLLDSCVRSRMHCEL